MTAWDFEALAFANASLLFFYWSVGFLVLYLTTRSYSAGLFLDPFHFYYAFTFGTSYGVVGLLATYGYVDAESLWIVFGFGSIFLLSYIHFAKRRIINFQPLVDLIYLPPKSQRSAMFLMGFIYCIFAAANLYVAGFGFLAESRFQSTFGFGPIIRVIDPIRLLLISWIGLDIVKRWKNGQSYWIRSCFLLLFAIFAALLNGAKFAFLEQFYAISMAVVIAKLDIKISKKGIYLSTFALAASILLFSFYVMSYNMLSGGSDPLAPSDKISGAPALVERYLARIIANGDMYFLSLPEKIYEEIHIDSTLTRLAAALLGSQIVSSLVGYDVAQFEVGRLIWLYWSPDDEVMRGPTNHFDLTGYFYFGSVGGIALVIAISILLSQIYRLTRKCERCDNYKAVFIAVLWCRSVPMLLHPTAGLTWFLDVIIVMILFKLLVLLINQIGDRSRSS